MIMRTFFGVFVLLFSINTVKASYQSDINLIDQIKPNHTARSKPTYPKFAAVSFLKSADTSVDFKGTLDIKSQCGALGYVMHIDKCTNKKNGKNQTGSFTYSRLCSDDPGIKAEDKEEAKKYTTGCCDKRIYTVSETAECPNNAAKLSNDSCYWGGELKYRCACDRGRYQYSTIQGEWCGVKEGTTTIDYGRFNANLACAAYEPRTEKTEAYFISCCPKSYSVCNADNHEVGRGNECRVAENQLQLASLNFTPKYEECICAPHYDTECPSDRVINGNLKCVDKNNKIWTPESNCESSCSKTIETNVDSYLYKSSWHCLYRKDGAIIRDDEDLFDPKNLESNEGYCGIFDSNSNTGSYDQCASQGFTKSEADCYNAETILRCPNDTTKVWCLEGKYCTGYNVGGTLMSEGADVSVCEPNKDVPGFSRIGEGSNAANVEFCPSYNSDYGWRCRYKYDAPIGKEDCNKCWNDGTFNPGAEGCIATDAENIQKVGMGSKCCNDGYYMKDGLCTKNTCNRIEYPYDIRPPYDAGEVVECREGDPTVALGYRAYFGYKSCNSDASKGEMWIEDPANNRRCVCARKGEGERNYVLPFDVDQYYNTNGDTSNNYANTGYYAGYYGDGISCTDADGSYYGYTMCYVGRTLVTTGAGKGMCISAGPVSYCNKYTCNGGLGSINGFLHWEGLEEVSSIKTEPRRTEDAFCVNKYTHCEARDGTKLGDEDVCAMVPVGCNLGYESACNECYHKDSVEKGDDGLYHAKDYTVVINSCRNDSRYPGVAKCPTGFKKCGGTYGCCYKYCYLNDVKECRSGDILASCPEGETCERSNVLASGAKRVAQVWWNYNRKLRLMAIGNGIPNMTWEEAKTAAAEYAPAGFEDHPIIGKGKWKLPTNGNDCRPNASYQGYSVTKQVYYAYYGPADGEGFTRYGQSWTAQQGPLEEGETVPSTAIVCNMGDSDLITLKTKKYKAFFILNYSY